MERVLVVEPNGTSCPLPGGDLDIDEVIGVPVGPVIGIVIREIGKILQPNTVGFRHSQARVLFQNAIHISRSGLVPGTVRQSVTVDQTEFLVAGCVNTVVGLTVRDAAVEQLKEVDVLRLFIQGVQKLVADTVGTILVEELLIEIRQLVAGEGADLLRLGPGEGDGADPGDQSQGQEQRRRPGLVPPGDAGDPVLQLPLARRHGGGGQQRGAGPLPHRDQGQQRPAVGDALVLSQSPDGGLVAGQLPVGLGDGGGRPHQGVEPVHRQAHAPQKGPQGV